MLTLKVQESLWACWIPRSVICMPLICYYYFTNNYYNTLYASINFLKGPRSPQKNAHLWKRSKCQFSNVKISIIHWQFCPPVQAPACSFSARESQKGQKQQLMWHKTFILAWERMTTQHRGRNGRDVAPGKWKVVGFIPAPLRHTGAGSCA